MDAKPLTVFHSFINPYPWHFFMKYTLLLRMAGPLQSWGTDSKFDIRRTNREPSKSGIIGFLASALGYSRAQGKEIEKLTELHIGIRADREGVVMRDYQMVIPTSGKDPWQTYRYYLQNAVFVVGVESENLELLKKIGHAVTHPANILFLGRKGCPPSFPIRLPLMKLPLEEALKTYPMQCEHTGPVRLVLESDSSRSSGQIMDVPVSFNPEHRQYTYRNVIETTFIPERAEHDPMAELGV